MLKNDLGNTGIFCKQYNVACLKNKKNVQIKALSIKNNMSEIIFVKKAFDRKDLSFGNENEGECLFIRMIMIFWRN